MNHLSTAAEAHPRAFTWKYAVAYMGSCVAWSAPSQLLLGIQLVQLRPEDKENALSLLMMAGGAAMVLTSLVTGWLSDTAGRRFGEAWVLRRWGKRLPWALLGAVLCALCLVAMAFTPGFGLLLGLWCAFQVFMAFVTNNLLTVMADVVPRPRYGAVSGALGVAYTVGMVAGTAVASLLPVGAAYVLVAVLSLVLVWQFGFGSSSVDDATLPPPSPPQHTGAGNVSIRSAGSYGNYWLVFASRFVIHLANYTSLFYLFYYLRDHIGTADPEGGVLILTVTYAAFTVAAAYVAGVWSDRVERRKVFVIAAALGIAGATVLMTVAGSVGGGPMTGSMTIVVIAACLLGTAWGVFASVDQAMINEALPSETHRARDVSIMTLTVGISNMLAGGLAALALNYLGGYPGLYLVCGGICVVGAVLVVPVKSSR